MNKAKLYHNPQSRSVRVAWLIHELEEKGYEVPQIQHIDISKELKSKDFLSINPLGTLPTFINEDGELILESGAIVLGLIERYENTDMVPKAKAKFYQWIVYSVSSIDPLLEGLIVQLKYTKEEDRDNEEVKRLMETAKKRLEYISNGLGKNDFICENTFSVADICLGFSLHFANSFELIEKDSNLDIYLKKLCSR
jgi:glutathione S-transferase